jgi:predicted nucleotidyltransferase
LFRLSIEALILVIGFDLFSSPTSALGFQTVAGVLISVHSLCWLAMGNFWVYMLDSFRCVRNTGIQDTLRFIRKISTMFEAAHCCDAVLVYGSFSRGKFHGRSDIDLRIVRRVDTLAGFLALPIALMVRMWSFVKVSPLDLQVVDSMAFLDSQMRSDELPVIVFKRDGFSLTREGLQFVEVESCPDMVLKGSDRD